MVSVLAFYSDNQSSNPAEADSFSVYLCLKRMKINKKRQGLAHFYVIICRITAAVNHVLNDKTDTV